MRLEPLRIGTAVRIALLATTVGLSAMALAACGSDANSANGGNADAGPDVTACTGITDDAGNCVTKCDDSMCNTGNYCVDNACRLVCTSHLDCPSGYQCLGSGVKDSDASQVHYCAPATQPMGEGEYLWPCPNGTECKNDPEWLCLGAGAGDADAYCSKYDCQSDADCPGGMWCGVVRDFHKVCGNAAYPAPGITPDPGDCVDPANFTASGHTYRLGPMTLLRNMCLPRGYCTECNDDLDCSLVRGNICVKTDPNQKGYCSRACQGTKSCPWEGASTCATVESSKGDTCNPTYGACVGNKDVCTPCRNDEDCWDASLPTRRACLSNSFTGERFCVDLDKACKADADCPKPPEAGKNMQCMTASAYQGSLLYQRCYPPDNGTTLNPGQPSCYRAP